MPFYRSIFSAHFRLHSCVIYYGYLLRTAVCWPEMGASSQFQHQSFYLGAEQTVTELCLAGLDVKRIEILGAFAKLRQETISFVMAVCPSFSPPVRLKQLGFH
jgi:hypothetical protein